MIRNVVMGRLRETSDEVAAARDRAQLERGLAGIAALDLPGMLANRLGLDAGLRAGGWTFAITNDWVDAESYHGYDEHEEHNIHRRLIGEVCDQIARVQFEVDATDRAGDRREQPRPGPIGSAAEPVADAVDGARPDVDGPRPAS